MFPVNLGLPSLFCRPCLIAALPRGGRPAEGSCASAWALFAGEKRGGGITEIAEQKDTVRPVPFQQELRVAVLNHSSCLRERILVNMKIRLFSKDIGLGFAKQKQTGGNKHTHILLSHKTEFQSLF